jgi:hypothetical protein
MTGQKNPAFDFKPEIAGGRVVVRPYDAVPPMVFASDAEFSGDRIDIAAPFTGDSHTFQARSNPGD